MWSRPTLPLIGAAALVSLGSIALVVLIFLAAMNVRGAVALAQEPPRPEQCVVSGPATGSRDTVDTTSLRMEYRR